MKSSKIKISKLSTNKQLKNKKIKLLKKKASKDKRELAGLSMMLFNVLINGDMSIKRESMGKILHVNKLPQL